MSRYWVLIADELLTDMDPSLLPDGFRITDEQATGGPFSPRSHWHLVEDDGAPDELDGKRVELTLTREGREGARAVITKRTVLP